MPSGRRGGGKPIAVAAAAAGGGGAHGPHAASSSGDANRRPADRGTARLERRVEAAYQQGQAAGRGGRGAAARSQAQRLEPLLARLNARGPGTGRHAQAVSRGGGSRTRSSWRSPSPGGVLHRELATDPEALSGW